MEKRTVQAWELNDMYVRMVRHMLATNDTESLLETGSGTPEEAEVLVRCYELSAMELWDEEALFEAALVAGDGVFRRSNGDPERIRRRISLAIKSGSSPEFMPPPDGIKLLYRIGIAVFEELEETVSRFQEKGLYNPDFDGELATESAGVAEGARGQAKDHHSAVTLPEPPPTWQQRAREIAHDLDQRDARAGAHDSITSMAERVAIEMRNRGINGPRGPLSGATIKREALQGKRNMTPPVGWGKRGE